MIAVLRARRRRRRNSSLVSSGQPPTGTTCTTRPIKIESLIGMVAAMALAGCGAISGSTPTSGRTNVAVSLSQFASLAQVEAAVGEAERAKTPPAHVDPSLQVLANGRDFGNQQSYACPIPMVSASSVDSAKCIFGDVHATRTMVLTGDSRAQMWFDTINAIATANNYRLLFLAKGGCPVPLATYEVNNNDGTVTNAPWAACTAWHNFLSSTIRSFSPQLVIVASGAELVLAAPAHVATPSEETADMAAFLSILPSAAKVVVLGGFPEPGSAASPSLCLSRNPSDISKCAYKPSSQTLARNLAIQKAALQADAAYINQMPWLCGSVCPAIIANIIPYTVDGYHIDGTYATYLTGVLWLSLEPYLS
jgi:SGNH domain (fused to AT3 domains)